MPSNTSPRWGSAHWSSGWILRTALILALAIMVLGLFLWRQSQATSAIGAIHGFPLDDSYIHLQFAKNLDLGHGLAFLPERPVAGSTSPLWTALLAPGFLISTEFAMFWAKLLGGLLFCLAALDLAGLLRDLSTRRSVALLGGTLFVLTETLAFSALSGMEVPLFVALLVRGMRLFVREEQEGDLASCPVPLASPSLWVFSVSVLARPEGLLVLVLAVGCRAYSYYLSPEARSARRERDSPERAPSSKRLFGWVRGLAIILTLILPPALLFWLWNGSMLPTTFTVKAGGDHRLLPSTRDVWRFAEILFRVQPWMTALAGAGILSLLRRRQTVLPALWFLGLPLVYSAMNQPGQPVLLGNFGRYAFPLLPFAILLGCLALDDLLNLVRGSSLDESHEIVTRSRPGIRHAVAAALVMVLLLPSVLSTWQGAIRGAIAVRNVQQSDVAAALWIRDNLPTARIGAQDIGALGFFADNDIVDLVGLVNPEILPFLRGQESGPNGGQDGTRAGLGGIAGLVEFVRRSEVDFLLLFPSSYGGLAYLQQAWPGLELVRRFSIDQNVAMAGEELLLLRLQ